MVPCEVLSSRWAGRGGTFGDAPRIGDVPHLSAAETTVPRRTMARPTLNESQIMTFLVSMSGVGRISSDVSSATASASVICRGDQAIP